MSYQVLTSTKVEKQLSKLNSVTVQAILEKIKSLARTPRPRGYKKLKGRVGV